jgi:hypothetical protein
MGGRTVNLHTDGETDFFPINLPLFHPYGSELKFMLKCACTYRMKTDLQTLKYLGNLINTDGQQVWRTQDDCVWV